MEQVEAAFTGAGFKVARNMPFAGAYICQHYGRPSRRYHALQIEIDRSIYMNEATITPNGNYETFKSTLAGVIAQLADIGRGEDLCVAAQ